jgi:hypothetical protein
MLKEYSGVRRHVELFASHVKLCRTFNHRAYVSTWATRNDVDKSVKCQTFVRKNPDVAHQYNTLLASKSVTSTSNCMATALLRELHITGSYWWIPFVACVVAICGKC